MGEGHRLERLAQQADYVASIEPEFEAALGCRLGETATQQHLDDGGPDRRARLRGLRSRRGSAKRSLGSATSTSR